MIRIAIVDDINAFCSQLDGYLNRSANSKGIKLDVSTYYTAERFCEDVKRGEDFDLLFMDIELGEMNGIEAVNFLRNEMGNEQMRIVFVSAISSYANELFKHDVMNFLVKPITYEAVDEVLSKYIRVYYNDNRAFTFKYMRKKFKFSYDDIIYFENEKRLMYLHTADKEYKFYSTMENLENNIKDTRFCRIHQSFIVNLGYVESFCADHVELRNGLILPVSKANRAKLIEKQFYLEMGQR